MEVQSNVATLVGHNSVQVPHNGSYAPLGGKLTILPGSKVKARSFFRPTTMSVAMCKAGIIPDVHLVRDLCATAVVRHRNDNRNQRPSAHISF